MASTPPRKIRASKTATTINLLRDIYGRDHIPSYVGSVHDGEELDDAELVLHELSHQVQLHPDFVFKIGGMNRASDIVGDYISNLPKFLKDVHEIRAVAIELIVARRLGLRFNVKGLIDNSQFNTALYRSKRYRRERSADYRRLVRLAKRSQRVQICAETILIFIEEQRNKSTCKQLNESSPSTKS